MVIAALSALTLSALPALSTLLHTLLHILLEPGILFSRHNILQLLAVCLHILPHLLHVCLRASAIRASMAEAVRTCLTLSAPAYPLLRGALSTRSPLQAVRTMSSTGTWPEEHWDTVGILCVQLEQLLCLFLV